MEGGRGSSLPEKLWDEGSGRRDHQPILTVGDKGPSWGEGSLEWGEGSHEGAVSRDSGQMDHLLVARRRDRGRCQGKDHVREEEVEEVGGDKDYHAARGDPIGAFGFHTPVLMGRGYGSDL